MNGRDRSFLWIGDQNGEAICSTDRKAQAGAIRNQSIGFTLATGSDGLNDAIRVDLPEAGRLVRGLGPLRVFRPEPVLNPGNFVESGRPADAPVIEDQQSLFYVAIG